LRCFRLIENFTPLLARLPELQLKNADPADDRISGKAK